MNSSKAMEGFPVEKLLIVLAAVGVAVFGGVWAASEPAGTGGTFVAFPLLGALGWWSAGWNAANPEDRRAARRIYALALAVRVPVLFFIHASFDRNTLAPDQGQYDWYSVMLLDYWEGKAAFPSLYIPAGRKLYFTICASFYWLFGRSPIGPKLLNAVAGSLAAAVVYRLTRHFWERRRAALIAGTLAAVLPSLILWSILQIRDALAIVSLVMLFEAFTRFQERPTPFALAGGVLCLWLVLQLRDYLIYPLGASLLAGALVGKSRSLGGRRALAAVALLALLVIGATTSGYSEPFLQEIDLEKLQQQRENLTSGGAAFAPEADISSPTGALAHLPLGLVYFLLGPFPWQVGTIRQVMAVPEMLAWYGLLPFLFSGVFLLWRSQGLRLFAMAGFTASATVMYSLVEGNLGTAFRHRAQVLVFFLIFIGVGLDGYLERRAQEREKKLKVPGRPSGLPLSVKS